MKEFNSDGLSFVYPENWTLEREDSPSGWTVHLQSPGTAYAVVCLDRELEDVQDAARAALKAFQETYPDLEATSAVAPMAGEMAVGHDMDFFSLDMPITCWTRCFYGLGGTVVVQCQVAGVDEGLYEPALRAICASMRAEEED
jgi:hypothetical protein